jgi:hypothetical protein
MTANFPGSGTDAGVTIRLCGKVGTPGCQIGYMDYRVGTRVDTRVGTSVSTSGCHQLVF